MTSSATPSSMEAKELSLIGKVELRIALADSDSKLEGLLKTYLAPLLLKLTSEHQSVRNKVISVCQHINTRIKPQSIQLPVASLLKQFKDNPDVALIRHFDLLYIQQGIVRLSGSERLDLLPILIHGLSSDVERSQNHGSQLFHLLLRLLHHFILPPKGSKEDERLRKTLDVSDEDAIFLSKWFGKLILLNISKNSTGPPPGLSVDDYKFLTVHGNPDAWNPLASSGLNLTETKVLVIRFLASGLFKDDERFLPAIFASADANSRLYEVAEDVLKRVVPVINLENQALMIELYNIYFGETGPAGSVPARTGLRTKILTYLSKSVASTTEPARIIRVVEEGLLATDTGPRRAETSGSNRGREIFKHRQAVFAYVNFVARRSDPTVLRQVVSPLLDQLKSFILDQGWPQPDQNEDFGLRGYVYEVIGLLAKADPQSILADSELTLLRWLFCSLQQDTSGKDTAVSIEEALSTMLVCYSSDLDETLKSNLRALLLNTRYVAVRYANKCLPYTDIAARWINILAVGAESSKNREVIEEGKRGLNPHWNRLLHTVDFADRESTKSVELPDFAEIVSYIFFQQGESDMDLDNLSPEQQVKRFLERYPRAFLPTLGYCRQIFYAQALQAENISVDLSADWSSKLDAAISADQEARSAIRRYIRNLMSEASPAQSSLIILLQACFLSLTDDHLNEKNNNMELYLIELCSLSPDYLVSHICSSLRSLELAILSNNHRRRTFGAHAFGILASHPDVDTSTVQELVTSMLDKITSWREAVGSGLNSIHGMLLAIAYLLSRLSLRNRPKDKFSEILPKYCFPLFDVIEGASDNTLQEAAILSINQLSLSFVLQPTLISQHISFKTLVDKISIVAKKGNEKAIIALGHLAMITRDEKLEGTESTSRAYIREEIYKLHEIRQPETQFAVGNALSCLACGWDSSALASELDVDAPKLTEMDVESTLDEILQRTLKDCKASKPSLRKASVIWLLNLLEYCGQTSEMKGNLPKCQAAFKSCLGDRDELVQEAASRGLGLVYERGDRDLRDDLVRDLVSTFSSDNKSQLAGNVTADTELFEAGALPTGEGSVTTYKDILSLASEVGDSSLVYKFMSLASNNAIWSSRAAFGRFGLSNILSDSSVNGYLAENPKLYPKLYRYKFDPNPNVQRSMNIIWNALVKDSNKTIDKYFEPILKDLLSSILGKEWRVRQASCAAIADLVQGRPLERYESYLEQIWTVCFKVLDDIKLSVRAAAASLARTLTGILTRSLEATDSSSKSADVMLKNVLPFLLSTSGLESNVEGVQAFALTTLLSIIKKSSAKTLRPFIPELVEKLLGLFSSLEPQAVNYIHLNASKYNLTEHKIDEMRLSSIRGSPLMESVERCLDLLDDETMQALVPRLENAMKTAVGLPSKVACGRVLVTMSTRHNLIFRPHGDHFLKLLEKRVLDRNDTVSSSYAASLGYVARVCSDEQILQQIQYCQKLYFDSEDDRHRVIAGTIIHAFSKYATDRFDSLSSDLLPFVFLAKHDSNDSVKEIFTDTWNENVAGPRAVSLYLKEIVNLAKDHLDSPKWALKHASARTLAGLIVSITTPNEDISIPNAETIWPVLDKAIAGKTWEGKEVVLAAFVRFVGKTRVYWVKEKDVGNQIIKVKLRRFIPLYSSMMLMTQRSSSAKLNAKTLLIANTPSALSVKSPSLERTSI
ncbi:ARM repeat-containing protein [Patellaria atrata CBS 101060]|uniref:ARM repeat-containing protein n=1 Tax=Patellaria atrata CBS 101060 TaxID=1346257 RepID=A0A9P4SJQ3_9PEZI|nr:ARM repeat-containing protein [Patellaria atrata CBS 101060]